MNDRYSNIGRLAARAFGLGVAVLLTACSSGPQTFPAVQGGASSDTRSAGAFTRGRPLAVIGSGFVLPRGVAVDAAGNVFVADSGNGAIKKVARDGTITTIATDLKQPFGISVDSQDDVFVACLLVQDGPVRMYPPHGPLVKLGKGFYLPQGVFVDGAGVVYVADTGNNLAKKIVDGQITRIGNVLNSPGGITADAAHNVYISNTMSNAVEKVAPDGTITPVGSGFNHPNGLAVDGKGDLFVADTSNNAIKEVEPNGTILTVGSGLKGPYGVALDARGRVYVADSYNNRIVRFKP